ncbi:E3 ubiquitin-protein ligase SH3RF1-like isoform X10 [Portunus trituberculatus]|uniref:E3 ubiquitin-protein ligase SH3RF1-like isoform X10 n=1 Tax=Portunus trituberculatus TaxID=210409 RepID=UPI001E1CF42D|nr:E3 ubiquitin-protein ligase SH3RF1-like isoform X10 [Portunus trituberculatus]XP_045124530.1 E3 ubiquitin-protein ligase SH3RF1-like isoform X10 [Portunus trituberculatus]XP_045124531.1 E3 ubiquitin-protein ligase SH3RF1-like isoform X10 [Portunus trituberculatus]XP_045124532.1 E3 ubiquitin-protein ligase SH3RF1-like isoform X10 [Portunus trituberculatus]
MEQLLLSDALECSVCLEQLGSNSRVLPCQHTFCRRCLDDIVETHKELRCPECRVLVEATVDELPPNILLMRILESMKSAPRPALSQPIKPSQTVPHPSQPPGRSDPHDGPPLTQAPPPPTIQSFQTSIAYTGTDSTHGFTGGGGGGGGGHSGPFGGSALSGTTLGGYSGSLGREGSIGHGGFNAGITSLGNLSINLTPSTQSSQHSPLPLTTHRQTSLQPCAKALYNYERKEAGDLSFKKGDVVILRKKIDSNWYEGELNNQVGFFPASYVQVITPLPSHIPQCKALYDFKMTNDEERDCLTFNKGEILTVLRRVDENWAEGKLGSRIGIFPLSFVDLNSAAKALMKLSLNSQQGPSRVAPPTPTRLEGEPATPLILSEGPGSHPPSTQPQQHVPLQIESSSSSSSVVTSPDPSLPSPTTSASPPNIGPSPSSPLVQSSAVAPLLRGPSKRHRREKRHSFTAVRTTQNPSPPRSPASPQRHSVEIISPTEENSSPGSTTGPTNGNGNGLVSQGPSSLEETVAGGEATTPPESMGSPRLRSSTQSSVPPVSSSTPQVNATTFYVALYSYRGRKADELELKKSHIYTVTEKCQDGWFKGRCITTDRTGVFPGNYVQVAKPQMISAYLAKRNARGSSTNHSEGSSGGGGGGSQSGSSSGSSSVPQTGVVSYTRPRPSLSGGPDGRNSDGSRGGLMGGSPPCLPPELPPRSVSSGTETSSAHRTSGLTSSSWHPSSQTPQGFAVNQRSVSGISNTVSPPPNIALGENSSVATSSTTPAKVERVRRGLEKSTKERGGSGGSGMSLMRKLASSGKKKSKSPPPSYSMDNPVFEDSTVSSNVLQHVHTRSGSNPDTTGVGVSSSPLSSSPPPGTQGNTDSATDTPRRKKQPAPLVRERFRCIVPYPPNSEYELELQLGDIIYVHKKRDDGWYKGTLQRTGKTGLFPASFVDSC